MAYTGPGDLQTFAAWWGLRAYSAATAGNACADIAATSGGATTTIHTLANGGFDTASAVTALGGNSGFITKLYDQTGNGHDLTQATAANKPQIQLSVLQGGTLPELRLPGVAFTTELYMNEGGTLGATNPWSLIAALKPVAYNAVARNFVDNLGTAAGGGTQGFYNSASAQVTLNYNSFTGPGPYAAALGSYHRLIGYNNSATSALYIDGSANTFTGDTTAWSGGLSFGDSLGGYSMNIVELGLMASSIGAIGAAAMDTNINNYWFASSGDTLAMPSRLLFI